jgi:hypothetical protein
MNGNSIDRGDFENKEPPMRPEVGERLIKNLKLVYRILNHKLPASECLTVKVV